MTRKSTSRAFRFQVYRVEADTLVPVDDEFGDPLYRVGLTERRVRDAAIEAAEQMAAADPEHSYAVLDRDGELVREVTACPAIPCPF